jgi:thiosulfate reductase/polysulfide reductase chain A
MTITRRRFLQASAATAAAIAACGGGEALTSKADPSWASDDSNQVVQTFSECNGCSNQCGIVVYTRNGKLWKVQGSAAHPRSKGKLCARGHGFATIAYAADRITDPLKRQDDGTYQSITWDQANQEIGNAIKKVLVDVGPGGVAWMEDPRPTASYYSMRFINALGSGNYFSHHSACLLSKQAGFTDVTGANNFSVDFANTKMVVFIGRNYAEGIRPSDLAKMEGAYERGAKMVLVDPRFSNAQKFCDQWIPIEPGTDLALLLAVANVLVSQDLYDHDFVAERSIGFDEWAPALTQYTPRWAHDITGVDADVITQLAQDLAAAAPACAIEPSWRAAFGCGYKNSMQTARAVAAVNVLLGCFNRPGGALITGAPIINLDKAKFIPVPATTIRVGSEDYPYQKTGSGSAAVAAKWAHDGKLSAMFFNNSNPIGGYGDVGYWKEALSRLKLKVCIDVQMSETAMLCDYVLPECTYLERDDLPDILGGQKPTVSMRRKALDLVHPNTRPLDQIICGLAKACDVDRYFNFTLQDVTDGELEALGTSSEQVSSKGTISLTPTFQYDAYNLSTKSGKFEFTSATCKAAGQDDKITWIAPKITLDSSKGELHLIGFKQAIHSHTMTRSLPILMQITHDYNLQRIWINSDKAAELGIKDGDLVEVSNANYTGRVEAKVTERIAPSTVALPSPYGGSSPYLKTAYGVGIGQTSFIDFDIEPISGSGMLSELAVTVKKVNA